MLVSFEVFKAAIRILQENSLEEVLQALESVQNHLIVLEQKLVQENENLSRSVIYYKKYQNQIEWKKQSIDINELSVWVPLFRQHKQANAFPDVKTATIKKIIKAKQDLDQMDLSLEELKLRLKELARYTRSIQAEIKTTSTQILVLETAADAYGFLAASNYDPKEIAEYEFEKYYELYRKAGETNG